MFYASSVLNGAQTHGGGRLGLMFDVLTWTALEEMQKDEER